MPIHDWTRVDHGTFHDFRQGWGPAIRTALSNGLLPPDYSAVVEPHGGCESGASPALDVPASAGLVSVATAPPIARFTTEFETDIFAKLRKTIVIRRGEDRVVTLIEIVSPGNKSSRHAVRAFVEKVTGAIEHGLHVLVIDLFPPGPRDPNGVHPVIWSEFRDETYTHPADKPLTLVSYSAGARTRAYIQPVAVGEALPDMALFLEPGLYVNVPLEATYTAAFQGVSRRTRDFLSGG